MGENLAMKKPIRRMAALFLAPAVIMYAALFIYPAIRAFYISLFDWNGFTSNMKFIGLKNFTELFADDAFWNVAAKNSLLITFVGGILIFAVAFLLCAVLSTDIKGKKFFELVLNGHDETCVYLQEKDGEWKLEKAKIAKICRAIDFDGLL